MFRDSHRDKLFDFPSRWSTTHHKYIDTKQIYFRKTNYWYNLYSSLYIRRVWKGQLQSAQLLKQETRPVLAPTNALNTIKQSPNPIFGMSFIPCDIIYSSVHREFRIAGSLGLRAFFVGAGAQVILKHSTLWLYTTKKAIEGKVSMKQSCY